ESRILVGKTHDPAMGMGSLHRNIKHLTGKYVGSSDTAADHGRSGAVDTGVRSLCPAKTKFHNPIAFCRIYHTGGFGGDKALMVQQIQDGCLYKLRLHNRGYDFQQRLSGEYHSSFRYSVNIPCKVESS